jgi:hypothetical protein
VLQAEACKNRKQQMSDMEFGSAHLALSPGYR